MVGPRFWIANQITRFGFRIALYMTGLVWAEKKELKADYSKYLGKDYKYRTERFGLQVQNHISPLELLIQVWLDFPINCLIGKREALRIPLFGKLCDP